LGSINFSNTAPSSREADQVPLISLASKDHQKPSMVSNVSAKFGGFLKAFKSKMSKLPSSDLLWPKDY